MSDALLTSLQAALGAAYTIRRELGGGGMSRVFVAEDHRLRRDVVVKVFPPSMAQSMLVDRFRREIMFAAGLQHPNVVPVLASGEADGLPYYVMPFIAGESLRVRLQRGPLSVREAASVMRDVARALSHAHARGLVHRDIKPGNILLTANSASVADFGVAKALAVASRHGPDGGTSVTMTDVGSSLGTPAYMAPEQVSADPTIDHRADLYALGIVAFEMLTGAPPFAGRSVRATMAAHLTEVAPRVDTRRYDVPPALADLIATLLEKDPDKRPRNADAVIRALDDTSFGNETRGTTSSGTVRGVRRSRRRYMITAALALVVLAAAALAVTYGSRGATVAPRAAVTVLVSAPELFSTGPQARAFGIGLPAEVSARLSNVDSVEVLTPAAATARADDDAIVDGAPPRYRFESVLQDEPAPAGAPARLHAVLRLVDDRSGRVLWAESVSFAADSSAVVQDRLAFAVTSAVRRHARLP